MFGDHKLVSKEKEGHKLGRRERDLGRVLGGSMNRIKIDYTVLEILRELISKYTACSHHLRVNINENSNLNEQQKEYIRSELAFLVNIYLKNT